MRIGISANTSWNIYNFRLKLIQYLIDKGHEVIIIAPKDDKTKYFKESEIEYIELKNLDRKGLNPIQDLRLMLEYRNAIRSKNLDVLMLYTIKPVIYGNIAKRFTKCFSIATITGLGYTFLNKGIASTVAKKLYSFSLASCNKVFFQNADDQLLFDTNKIISKEKTSVINGSGIDTKTILKSSYIEGENIKLLFVGRMLIDKGIVELIKAFRYLLQKTDNIVLHLVGGLDEDNPSMVVKDFFSQLIDDEHIIYHGESDNVIEIMKDMNIVVLPSYREGIPRVLLEAMALGKPIIGTNAPGCKDVIIEGYNGLLCEVKSVEDLALKINQILEMSYDERKTMGLNGRKLVESRFDQEIISEIYNQVIISL
jgi:glycosyltransferase involved in cell wall biosynthesis